MTKLYSKVSEVEFVKFLEDTKNNLLKVAPEFRVEMLAADNKKNYCIHRWDYKQGKDWKPNISIRGDVIAYEEMMGNGELKLYILDGAPLWK